jgi:hypothetical protein
VTELTDGAKIACQMPFALWYTLLMSTVSDLDRFLEPVTDAFTLEFARWIVGLRADVESPVYFLTGLRVIELEIINANVGSD